MLFLRDVLIAAVNRLKTWSLYFEGLTSSDRMKLAGSYKKKGRYFTDDEETLCEVCKMHLYVSMVSDEEEEEDYCLEHAVQYLKKGKEEFKLYKLFYTYTLPELTSLFKQMEDRISTKSTKKGGSSKRNLDCDDSMSSHSSSTF